MKKSKLIGKILLTKDSNAIVILFNCISEATAQVKCSSKRRPGSIHDLQTLHSLHHFMLVTDTDQAQISRMCAREIDPLSSAHIVAVAWHDTHGFNLLG